MNSKSIISSLIAASLGLGGFAFAQGDGDVQAQQRATRQLQRQQTREAVRQYGPAAATYGQDVRGAGPDHRFRRGDRLPPEYRHRSYVVDDWRSHRLSAPPRGYQWVQSGGDYLLVAIATGIIAQLLLNN
ncbi:MAG: integral rane protein-like [Ramlibacter sp.]|nr:integral rane protein-like [Ramlibacter sp.]